MSQCLWHHWWCYYLWHHWWWHHHWDFVCMWVTQLDRTDWVAVYVLMMMMLVLYCYALREMCMCSVVPPLTLSPDPFPVPALSSPISLPLSLPCLFHPHLFPFLLSPPPQFRPFLTFLETVVLLMTGHDRLGFMWCHVRLNVCECCVLWMSMCSVCMYLNE